MQVISRDVIRPLSHFRVIFSDHGCSTLPTPATAHVHGQRPAAVLRHVTAPAWAGVAGVVRPCPRLAAKLHLVGRMDTWVSEIDCRTGVFVSILDVSGMVCAILELH